MRVSGFSRRAAKPSLVILPNISQSRSEWIAILFHNSGSHLGHNCGSWLWTYHAPTLNRYILFLAIIYPNLKLWFFFNPWKICPVDPSHTLFLDLVKSSLYSEILSPPPRNPFPEPWKSPGGGVGARPCVQICWKHRGAIRSKAHLHKSAKAGSSPEGER